jgi:hypothetical protein
MDEVYDDAERSNVKFKYFDQEVQDILREAYGAKKHAYNRKDRQLVSIRPIDD